MQLDTLPATLRQLLRHTSWQRDTLGMSSSQTYRITGPENFYLKIGPVRPFGSLRTEAEALRWLGTRLPAPDVVFYERVADTDYLLMRALPGLPASDGYWKTNPKRLAEVLGQSMRALHSLDPASCPFDQRTATRLREVAYYVQHGLVDTDDFEPENTRQTPQELLDQLYAQQPPQDDLVVTHGDYCLPNVLLDNWHLSGFIDVGGLGVGDRYQDLALCARSLEHNAGTDQYNALLFEAYGLTRIDDRKLTYYRLLDELK